MNWAMPCAPAPDPAFGFQLDSCSICAAMMLGVTTWCLWSNKRVRRHHQI